MMHRYNNKCTSSLTFALFPSLISLILLLIFASRSIDATRTNYAEVLKGEFIVDKLRLLSPENLLRNHKSVEDGPGGAGGGRSPDSYGNRTCARDLAIYERAIERRESWALKMLDASSKIPTGILQGNVVDMGMFDECMEAHSESHSVEIHGRHCMYAISPTHDNNTFPWNPTLSICLPASCSANDVMDLVNQTITNNEKLKDFGITVASATCTNDVQKMTDVEFNVYAIIVTTYVSFLILCTVCDLAMQRFHAQEKQAGDNLMAALTRFSMLRNAEAILSTKVQEGNLAVIHGIRVLSTAWVVLIHEYFVQFFGVNVNALDIAQWLSSPKSLLFLIGFFSVDTFLVLSGFLMTYTFFRQIEKNGRFNLPLYYLHRFIRLTLPVAAIVFSTYLLIPSLTSGARSEWLQNIFVTGCRTKQWSFLFYMQNFVEKDNYCLAHLWSLSVDMQLFWISPFILYPLYKRPKVGLAILASLFLTSIIVTATIVGLQNYSAIYLSQEHNVTLVLESFKDVYEMPYTRASPWLLGILFGYEVTYRNFKPNKLILSIGWIMASMAFAFCILGTRSFINASYEYNVIWEIIFAALARPFWAFGVCWIIYASVHNFAEPISTILSSKIFLPLSKISYSIYLVHIVIPMLQVGISRAPKYFNQYIILHSYISDMGLAIVAAFFFSLIFEVPMLVLEDIIFRRKKDCSSKERKHD